MKGEGERGRREKGRRANGRQGEERGGEWEGLEMKHVGGTAGKGILLGVPLLKEKGDSKRGGK